MVKQCLERVPMRAEKARLFHGSYARCSLIVLNNGQSIVYRAIEVGSGRPVALKKPHVTRRVSGRNDPLSGTRHVYYNSYGVNPLFQLYMDTAKSNILSTWLWSFWGQV